MHGQDLIDRIILRRGTVANNSDEEDYVLPALNEVYREVLSYHDWSWLIDHKMIRTWPLKTFTADADPSTNPEKLTDVTDDFSAAEQTAYVGGYIAGPGREFHRISAFEDAGDTVVMEEDWIGAAQTAGAFEAWQDTYSMGTGCDHLLRVGDPHEQTSGYQLQELSEYEIDSYVADRRLPEISHLLHWSRDGVDASGAPRIRIWPVPRESTYLIVAYKRRPADLANSTGSVPVMPLRWHHILVIGTVAKLAEDDGLEDQATLRLKAEYLGTLERMVNELPKKSAEPRRMKRWDEAYPPGQDPNRWWQIIEQS